VTGVVPWRAVSLVADEQLPPARLAAEIRGRLAASDSELSGF
jgi:hypothetical protein